MRKALELTWVAKLKQWRKRRTVNGKSKSFYLGAGNGKSDRISYIRALAKWREIEKTLDHAARGEESRSSTPRGEMLLYDRRSVSPLSFLA